MFSSSIMREQVVATKNPILLMVATYALYKVSSVVHKIIHYHVSPLWKLPGPPKSKSSWLMGNFFQVASRPFMEPHLEWIAQFGGFEKVEYVRYTFLFGQHSVLVLNAEQAQKILLTNYKTPPRYVKKFEMIKRIIGNGLVTLEGDDWYRHRRMINPSFNLTFLTKTLQDSVPPRLERFVECLKQAGGQEIDLGALFSLLTLDIIGQAAFHHDFEGITALEKWASDTTLEKIPETHDKLVQSLSAAFKPSPRRLLLGMLNLESYRLFDPDMSKLTKHMNDAVDGIIVRAKERRVDGMEANLLEPTALRRNSSKYAAKSILDLLLDANDSLTPLELRDEVKTFLVAGHETTSSWCYWATYALTKYPDVQQRLYDELTSKPSSTVEEINQLSYLHAFLQEVLRVHPPVGMIIRHTTQDETFGEYHIPANTRTAIPIYLMHHNPKYWKHPETFWPERWLQDKPPNSHNYAFLPFSAGPRNCIGYRFATLEAKMIMAGVIQKFTFELAPSLKDKKITMTSFVTIKAKPGLKVLVKER
jgi:cytochrome P450